MCIGVRAAPPVAGRFFKLRRMPATASIHLAIAHGHHVGRFTGVTLRQTRQIHPTDVQATRADGVTDLDLADITGLAVELKSLYIARLAAREAA